MSHGVQVRADYTPALRNRDLLYHFLYRWRSILAAVLIGAVVLGGWAYLSQKKAHDAGERTREELRYDQDLAMYREEMAKAEKNLAESQALLQEATETRDRFLQEESAAGSETTVEGLTAKNLLHDEITKYEGKVEKYEREINNLTLQGEPTPPDNPVIRRTLTGGALALIVMLVIYLTTFLMSGKIREGKEISEAYGVPLFGEMNRSGARKPGKGIDGWLEKRQFRKNPKTEAQVLENAAAMAKAVRGEGTLLLTGTAGEEALGRVRDAFVKALGEDTGIEMLAGFPTASGAVEKVCEAGSVVWVEEKHVSRREQVRAAAEAFETSGANVIGVVVV